jgi:peroxiredoxin
MVELGELEARHSDFARRDARVVVVSIEGREDAQKTQEQFPHLVVLSDPERKLAAAADVIHKGVAPGGGDTTAPTTVLIDRQGVVRWLFRPDRHIERLSAAELLAAVDQHLHEER